MGSTQSRRRSRGSGSLRLLSSGRWQARAPHPTEKVQAVGPKTKSSPEGAVYERPRMVSRTFLSKVDAQAWLNSPDFERVEVGAADDRRMLTLQQYADGWLPDRRARGKGPLKPRTVEHYRKLLDAYVLPDLGGLRLDQITPTRVDRWHATLDPATATMNAHAYSLLRAIMGTAVRQDRIPSNPCRIEGAGQAERVHSPVMLSVTEVLDLSEAMPDRYRAMVLLAAFCGLRFGELTELRRSDVNLAEEVVRVRRGVVRVDGKYVVGTPKSRAGQRAADIPEPLIPALTDHLSRHVGPESDALLFPAKNGGHMAPSTLYKPFYRARTAIDHPDLRWHDLRHVAATLAAGVPGVGLADLQAVMGHSTVTAAMRYQQSLGSRRRMIADGIGDVIAIESRHRTASGT